MAWRLADLALTATRVAFGETLTWTPASTGVPESITAPFDDAWEDAELFDPGEIVTVPMVGLRKGDLSVAPAQGDTVVARGVTYEVTELRDDGHGGTMAILVEVV